MKTEEPKQAFFAPDNKKLPINKMTSGNLVVNNKIKNLRIVEKVKSSDVYGTGDQHYHSTYEVRRDYTIADIGGIKGREVRYTIAHACLVNGIVVETFNSKNNAQIFLEALKKSLKNR